MLTGPDRMAWGHVVYDTEAQTGKRDGGQEGISAREKNGETGKMKNKRYQLDWGIS